MLPIAKRRTLEVPHGLAAIAASVCLILAFATDQSSVEDRLRAQQSGQSPVEQTAEDGNGSKEDVSEAVREQRKRGSGLSLLPWFPGYAGGRG